MSQSAHTNGLNTDKTLGNPAVRSLKAYVSDIMSNMWMRMRSLAYHGLTHQGKRDLYHSAGYPRVLTVGHYRAEFQRGGVAERLVEIYPRAVWASGPISVFENEDPDIITPFESQFDQLATRLSLWEKMRRAHTLAGLGHYSILLIGVAQDKDLSKPLTKVLPSATSAARVLYIKPFAEDRAQIETLEDNPADPRYGQPLTYRIKMGGVSEIHQDGYSHILTNSSAKEIIVHWTRVIHFAQGLLEDEIYGVPFLRSIFNYLIDLQKIVSAGGEGAWNRADPGLQFDLDPEFPFSVDGGKDGNPTFEDVTEDLRVQIQERQDNLRKDLMTSGVTVKELQTPVQNFGSNADSVISLICATKRIPQNTFKGAEEGKLQSIKDRNNWNDAVGMEMNTVGTTHVRALIDRLIEHGYLIRPAEYQLSWPIVRDLTELEKATLIESLARANVNQAKATGEVVYDSNEMREKVGDGPRIELDDDLPIDDEDDDEDLDLDGEDLDGIDTDDDGDEDDDKEIRVNKTRGKVSPINRSRALSAVRRLVSAPAVPAAASQLRIRPLTLLERKREWSARNITLKLADPEEAGRVLDTLNGRISSNLSESEFSTVRRIAKRYRKTVSTIVVGSWLSVIGADDLSGLESALELGPAAAENYVISRYDNSLGAFRADMTRAYGKVIGATGKKVVKLAKVRGSFISGSDRRGLRQDRNNQVIEMAFDLENPRVLFWASKQAGELITEMTDFTKGAIREMIADGLQRGVAPRVLAKEIRNAVGLRSDQVKRLSKLREAGKTPTQLNRAIRKMRNQRALLIARTETMRAANEGLKETWIQAQEAGLLPANVKREWMSNTDRHADRDGVKVGITESWPWLSEPGAEPNCGCSQGIVEG
jgi:uncharacterized protein